ncbi:UDP-4-amino-4,6-dideoxy-N-acetyl-beta-L-altrosamine transaminase [Kordiimonas sediminis]|uniref:UDP-4-amino-4, 6-dideoxy-N-acetyl-beta-L-altrosamine transaminase n=1 Tax=Kordiimonas sediminis TaxID=1735581 RepID=A0A919AYZ3_9PROT|nr:UDP-4-amino-4,6-dideoxy-N-acetyl-beta-L-altrosamine transaminase [Kordiimonas sediminis]GHF29461.1 UDP-4-amino-4,6-dideoxy-N-acetyl-beta-L-altrosamine transaminase [Kordiimonas sediminis]
MAHCLFLPYGQHTIEEDDIEAVSTLMRSGALLTSGPEADFFEAEFAAKVGSKEAVVVSNGTAALHLAVLAAGLGPGDVAVVPSVTFLSTANVVRMVGAEVVFADVDNNTGLMTPETLTDAIQRGGSRVRAVLPVHLNGQTCDMESLSAIARRHNLLVISDCCHALGAEYAEGGKPGDGHLEDMGCFSLHPVKSIAMGEGGVITLNDAALADRLRRLRSHGMTRDPDSFTNTDMAVSAESGSNPWYYEMQELGYNYRATDIQCALGRSQLKKLDRFVARRREIAAIYDTSFKAVPADIMQPVKRWAGESAWHLYPVLIDFGRIGLDRAGVMTALRDRYQVGTQVHYIPVHLQPYYKARYGVQDLPGVAHYYERCLSLPIFPKMTDDDVRHVCMSLCDILGVASA